MTKAIASKGTVSSLDPPCVQTKLEAPQIKGFHISFDVDSKVTTHPRALSYKRVYLAFINYYVNFKFLLAILIRACLANTREGNTRPKLKTWEAF